ncbi:MAG TPA: tetratricopeptide repeat protein, partial [Anaerolinea sp.]|nr:tetratricopeptide repeat protein [Anaerolinea sp.]
LVQAGRGLSLENQLHLLKALKFNGLDEVVEKAAVHLASSQAQTVADHGQPDASITSLTDQAIAFQRIASLHQLAGNPALAEKTLRSAFSVLETIRAGLELQAGSLGRPIHKGAWIEKAVAVLPGEGTSAKQLMGQVGLALHGLDPAERAGVKTGSQGQDPFLQLHEAECQFLLGKKDLSAEIARSAADEFLHQLQESRLYLGGDFTFTTNLPGFIRSLFQLDQVKEAAEVADAALRVDPSNPDLVALASQVHLANEHLSRSKELATIAAHLQPDNLDNLRHLALVCERLDDWPLASRYRKDCLEHPEGGELADQTAYARSALKAGDLLAASQMCEQILADRPDDGTVHGLMGLTRAAQGRDEEALMHFNRATLVASETAEWWLALAEQHEKMGDGRTALETLRAAVLAAPDSGDIHYRLGELYLNGGMNSEALPHLKKAAALKSENSAIAFKLAKALHALGFLSEARQVIDQLKDQWAGKPEIAFEYAVVALAMDDVDAAIPALEIAAQSEDTQTEWLMTYASLLLNDRIHALRLDEATRYEHAEALLQKSLEISPDDAWTSILLAEAMNKAGKFQAAYDLYQHLVELPEVVEKGWMWRIQHGYGLAAIGLRQVEAGITMLQEAASARPDSLEVARDLTDAYLSANLEQEAGETAEHALEIAPDDHQNLDWFAGVMMRLGKSNRAAEALRCAIELSPEQSELRVRFAQLAIENGNVQDAKDALRKLPELDNASPFVLRQAAFLHLRVQEPLEAIENLEKAVIVSDPPDAQLLFDLSKVYAENGRIDDAITTVQKIPEAQQGVGQQVFYADLLAKQKRYQAAMLVIERALKSILKSEVDDDGQLAGIYARTSKWSRELGNVASAFEQVEKALEYEPDDLNLRFLATNLAAAMLLNDKAGKYALLPFEAVNHQNLEGVGMKLAALSGHLALENNQLEDAQSLYDVCAKIDPEDRWVQSLNARLLVRRGAII